MVPRLDIPTVIVAVAILYKLYDKEVITIPKFNKGVKMNMIEIWEPNYGRQTAMIDPRKVQLDNIVYFSKAKSLTGKEYYISKEDIVKHPLVSNGRIMCHDVPMGSLRELDAES